MGKSHSSTPKILSDTWTCLVPKKYTRSDFQDPLMFWGGLVDAHESNVLKSLAETLLGKPWGQVTKRDAQARR